jgi:tetratricopeptide (TPR) repeat protein
VCFERRNASEFLLEQEMRRSFQYAMSASCLAFSLGLAGSAWSAGGMEGGAGGDSGTAPVDRSHSMSQTKEDLTTCPRGQIWDTKRKSCLKRRSSVLPDDQVVEYAYALAKADRYEEALETLDLLQDPHTARALNYRGYANRKLGRTGDGIGYYLKSIEVDPNYAQVREYLGEAYMLQGKVDAAKDQLETIAKICGSTECEEYEDLEYAISHNGETKS